MGIGVAEVTPDQIVTIVGGAVSGGGLAFWLIRREVARVDSMAARLSVMENNWANLATKDVVATRDDVTQVSLRLDRVDKTLNDVQILLARLEERWKLTHGE